MPWLPWVPWVPWVPWDILTFTRFVFVCREVPEHRRVPGADEGRVLPGLGRAACGQQERQGRWRLPPRTSCRR